MISTLPSLSGWLENFLLNNGRQPGANSRRKIVTVIGSGGKTSLIWFMAAALAVIPDRKILVTPTTKMLVPPYAAKRNAGLNFYTRYFSSPEMVTAAASGITLAGNFNKASGKLESFPLPKLESMINDYDFVLIEGDGSRALPYKAWESYEPVVPSFTDLTIGMLPIQGLGEAITEKTVCRLELFLARTGALKGEALTKEHLKRVISGNETGSSTGLFAKARGKKLLFLNQVEDAASLKNARELAEILPKNFRKTLAAIIAGSVMENLVFEL